MDIAYEFKKIRESLGISQQKMAEMIGIPQKTWCNYENGRTRPKMDILLALAAKGHTIQGITSNLMEDWSEDQKKEYQRRMEILKTGAFPPEMLMDDFTRIVNIVDAHPPLTKNKIPIYTPTDMGNNEKAFVVPLLNQKLSAGKGQELPQNDEATALIPVPSYLAKFGKNIAALTVEGDSMYPTLERGDVVVCDSCGWSGEGVYALRMGGDGFVKRLTKAPGKLVIISDNPKYPAREEPEESQDYEIIGRVHCAIKNME
jgi:transcriptional regulator with XRE-family HTH domain